MRLKIMIACCLLISVLAHAQDKPLSRRAFYTSQNFIGLLEGENKAAFQLQTIHGLRYRSWYSGVGVGLDYYMFRSVPVFVTVNKDIAINKRTFFVSADAGPNFAWVKNNPMDMWGLSNSDFDPGLYWSAGVGYKAFFKNKTDAILINIGYSQKRLKETRENTVFCIMAPCPTMFEQYDYMMKRISIRLGWQF